MEIRQIETYLESQNPQDRMRAITALRHHEAAVAVPLLKRRIHDQELIIRSFVAMGLGAKRTDDAFQLLVSLIETDRDPNIRAEAANSLGNYGEAAIPHLAELFRRDSHWLVRQSIYAAINLKSHPELLLELARIGLQDTDPVVRQVSVANLGQLAQTPQANEALELLLVNAQSKQTELRVQAARVLPRFDDPRATEAIAQLRQDSDHRVIAATLEDLL